MKCTRRDALKVVVGGVFYVLAVPQEAEAGASWSENKLTVTDARAGDTVEKLLRRLKIQVTTAAWFNPATRYPTYAMAVSKGSRRVEGDLWVAPLNNPDLRAPLGFASLVLLVGTYIGKQKIGKKRVKVYNWEYKPYDILATPVPAGGAITIMRVGMDPALADDYVGAQ